MQALWTLGLNALGVGSGRLLRRGAALVVVVTAVAPQARAQTITVTGMVIDEESRTPVPTATVDLIEPTGRTLTSVTTAADGTFRVSGSAPGRVAILISALGYLSRRIDDVDTQAGSVGLGTIALSPSRFALNPIVVTASRRQERAIDAPASVHVVDAAEIERRPATSAVDHLIGAPGVDVVTSGVSRHSLAVRGFNATLNSDLLVLTDYRWAALPSLRLNAFNLLSTSNDDIERIEVVAGPGSALYGPNTANGVVHVITKSPLDQQGTSVSLIGGERSLFQGSIRHAGLLGEDVGYKLSGTYLRADEWEHIDPVEAANRKDAIDAGASPGTLRIGARDFASERFSLDSRIDARLGEASVLTLSGGMSRLVSGIEQLTTQTAQARDWTYSYAHARLTRGRLFAQAYANLSDAGSSYSLSSGAEFVDRSRVFSAAVQHGADVGEHLSLTYGGDYTATRPRTGGTIHGSNEAADDVNEIGAYAQAELGLSDELELVVAGRIDRHNVVDQNVLSPRAALVYTPRSGHSFRATYNRAFLMPTTAELFADLVSSPSLGGLPFAVNVRGHVDGWTFSRDCGGLCMRSPFTPTAVGGPAQPLPVDATLLWGAAVQIVAAQNPTAGAALALMAPPTGASVGTVLRVLDPQTRRFDIVTGVADVAPAHPSVSNTFEVGYKGLIGDRMLLGVDVYHSRVEDFISSAFVLTPSVFLDPTTVGAHLAAEAARLHLPLDAATITALAGGLAGVPLATVVPEAAASTATPADLLLTFRNFGEVSYWGTDLSIALLATDRVRFRGSYSYISQNLFETVDGFSDVPLNSPRHKGSLSIALDDPRRGWSGEVRGRVVGSFPFASGVFVGDVESYGLVDVRLNYSLPFVSDTDLIISAINVLNDRHFEAPGAAEIGRLVTIMIRAGL